MLRDVIYYLCLKISNCYINLFVFVFVLVIDLFIL